jgi:hypothetical protein
LPLRDHRAPHLFRSFPDALICSTADYLGQKASGFSITCIAWCVRRCSSPSLSGESQRCSADGVLAHLSALCYARAIAAALSRCIWRICPSRRGSGASPQHFCSVRKFNPKQPFMTQLFANCHREVALQLVLASESAILLSVSALRKFAHQMLHFFQEKYGIVVKHSDNRLTIIRDLHST